MYSAWRGYQRVRSASACSAPAIQAPPRTPPAPRTNPERTVRGADICDETCTYSYHVLWKCLCNKVRWPRIEDPRVRPACPGSQTPPATRPPPEGPARKAAGQPGGGRQARGRDQQRQLERAPELVRQGSPQGP